MATILSGGARLLPKLVPANSAAAESRLKALGVKTVNGVKVSSSTKNADGTTTVTLDDGSSKTVDVFIDATGPKPNSSFLPQSWLNSTGHVVTASSTPITLSLPWVLVSVLIWPRQLVRGTRSCLRRRSSSPSRIRSSFQRVRREV